MAPPNISPAKLAAKLKKHTANVRVADLADAIIRKFGGLEQFAAKYVEDYEKAPKGSISRARLMSGALRLVEMVSKKDDSSAVEDMTDAELENSIDEHLTRLLKATPIVDMEESPAPQGVVDGAPPIIVPPNS